ncbi:pyrroline-5-carboxylate reductase [Meridianimarinicoccus roseus]|uniref:Pyrroline-5-carboxylate reductase n=1 Tax=Meridianimarinicoccus roseus TaxID=2072018 RepID=A0A2V2LPP5_9RHOB|nr:NAD(P)-binding domain-containing protein [Meridianimarinicoccus roseus]PWR03603.1 pyrroline-5-carboxylate reductase [Meridianimarinicoccus roseus]
MARIGFLGTGEIAGAMVRGLAGQGHRILVSERNADHAAMLARTIPEVTIAANPQVVAGSDVVIACLMAATARQVLPDLPWRSDHTIISVMVDVPHGDLATLCAPATDIALTIPMPFISSGGCPLPVFPDAASVTALFGARNLVLPVASEVALNAHFAASALSAPILRLLAEGTGWLARETGDPVAAEAYVTALFAGYMTPDGTGRHFAGLLDSLATEGGLNAALRAALEDLGAPAALGAGMDTLRPRLGLPPATGAAS